MKILSIDIGIKNLAYIILDHNEKDTQFNIIKWDIINICNFTPNCSECNNKAKYRKNDLYYCNKHAKNSKYKIPPSNLKILEKKNINELKNFISENNIEYNNENNKKNILKNIYDYYKFNYLDNIEEVNANAINIINLGININTEFNKLFQTFDLNNIDIIVIENQIGPIANRMKTIQGMVAQYFINNNIHNIEFISSINKLKLFCNDKNRNYNERKKMSIEYCANLLIKNNKTHELEIFNTNKKKDDLADCFLQAIYYLTKFNNLKI